MERFILNILNISMEEVFLKLLNMSIAASWLILAVVILRVILKKAPKVFRCFLWALVAVRLICPFSFESVLSLIPSAETIPQDIMYMQEPAIHSGVYALNSTVNPVLSESLAPTVGDSVNPLQVVSFAATIIWMMGLIVMIIYAAFSYFRVHRKVCASIKLKENMYLCDYIDTPFILGIIKPRIYIPSTLEEDKVAYVIAHEKAHIKRHDHWWKPLGYALLCVYWFNPVIWLAYILLCRDIELACDESVIKKLGEVDKKPYSEALLFCSVPRKMMVACPLAFGEVGVKERVRTVLNYKKPAFWVIAVAVIVCVIVAICFLTNPREGIPASQEPFGNTFSVKELLYDAPEYSSTYPVGHRSIYSFTSDHAMLAEGNIGFGEIYEDWIQLGWMREIDLNKENFDNYFRDIDGVSGWMSNHTAGRIRRNNEKAWELIVEDDHGDDITGTMSYYLLQQKSGDVYLACWYYDGEREVDPYSDDSAMRWLLELERADYITLTVETVGESAFYDMKWYPDGQFDFQYEDLPTNIINTQGTLVFRVDGDVDTLTVGEDYYEQTSEGHGVVKRGNYILTRNAEGVFTLDVSRRGSVSDEYAVYYVPYEGGKYVFKVDFPVDTVQSMLAGNYVSSDCLYMNPLSSLLTGSDSGKIYQFVEDALIIQDRLTGKEQRIIPQAWEWQEFPYTDEEWNALMGPVMERFQETQHISEQYEEIRYLRLSGKYCLLWVDGSLWLVQMNENPQMGEYIWSIYSLVTEGSMGSAEWEYQPMLNSRYPAFPIQFTFEDAEVVAYCTNGALIDYDNDGSEYPQGTTLTIPTSSKLYWAPRIYEDEILRFASETEIGFYIMQKDGMILYSGTIYITREDNINAPGIFTARLVGGDMTMAQNEGVPGAVVFPTVE